MTAAQFRENQRYLEETRREIGAREAREARAPRIHALIDELWEAARVEPNKARRDSLEQTAAILQSYAERGGELAPDTDAEWRKPLGLEVRS